MLLKTALLFLLGMALLAMVGKAIAKASGRTGARLGVAKFARCPQCGSRDVAGAVLGKATCKCGKN